MADAVSAARERLSKSVSFTHNLLAPSYSPVWGTEYQSCTDKGHEDSTVCPQLCGHI